MDALTQLALQARAGNDRALEALVKAAYDQVWRLCASLVDRGSAEDLAQETMLRAVRALPQFRGEASARTWLLAIARHTCMDELRSRSRRPPRLSPSDAAAPREPMAPDAAEELVLLDLVARLRPERRIAFVLTQVMGLTYEDAAKVCECPPGSIRSRVARARADLHRLLSDETQASRFVGESRSVGMA